METSLFAIISKVPERISKCTSSLRLFTANFLFFSDMSSFLGKSHYPNLRVIILDNVDETLDIAACVQKLRRIKAFAAVTIIALVKEAGHQSGIAALSAGCNDYVAYPLVEKELSVRIQMHLRSRRQFDSQLGTKPGCDLSHVHPIEDRALLQSAVWHIQHAMASLKSVNDLAMKIGYGEREINRAFNEHLGQSAFAYIRECRIQKAKTLLSNTRYSVTQIAQEVGYSSSANFSTAFKSVVGMSPREYRRQELLSL